MLRITRLTKDQNVVLYSDWVCTYTAAAAAATTCYCCCNEYRDIFINYGICMKNDVPYCSFVVFALIPDNASLKNSRSIAKKSKWLKTNMRQRGRECREREKKQKCRQIECRKLLKWDRQTEREGERETKIRKHSQHVTVQMARFGVHICLCNKIRQVSY